MRLSELLRQWWVILLTAAVALVASIVASTLATPTYRVSSSHIIAPAEGLTETETIVRTFDSLQGQGIVPTLLEVLTSGSIQREVAAELGLDPAAAEEYEVDAAVLSESNTIELTVAGPDGEVTASYAAAVGERATALFEELYPVYQVVVLDEPAPPDAPASPRIVRNAILAYVLGLVVGVGVAALRARSLRRRRSAVRTAPEPAPLGDHSRDRVGSGP